MGDPQWVTGILGGAMEFDGDDYLDAGDTLTITDPLTIACWVNPAGLSGDNGWVTRQGAYAFKSSGDHLRFTTPGIKDHDALNAILQDGTWQHVAVTFEPEQAGGAVFYINGVEMDRVDASSLSAGTGPFLIANNQWSQFYEGMIDDVRVYNKTLTNVEILALNQPHITDVTAPGDLVQGVPNDGVTTGGGDNGWPGAETPDLAIDDDTGTKYLHFKGNMEPTGFQIEPALGASVVTGLTFTTANDAIERDPISYELSGSNDSIDGPYTLIASGDIVDFAQETALPRFTMNATPITFANTLAYKYYQVMFPTVRDAGSANSMQIAEVELLGVPAPIGHWPLDGDALDISGNGNDGILMGDPQFVAGMVDGAIELDGVDDYVDCGNAELLDITGEMTVAAWVKVDLFDKNWQAIVTHGDSSWRIHRSSGSDNVAWGTSGASPADITGTTNVNDGQWHHIAGVFDGAQKFLYVDGAVDASADFTGTINSSAIHSVNIGENNQATGRYFTGLIDDVRIYDKGLHPLQVRDLASPPAVADVVLKVDFNSSQDGGGDSTTAGDPGLSEAAHNQEGWSSYHANHEVIDEFATADYDGITVTPAWPNTTDNRVQQSIDRSSGNDDNWDNAAGDIDLVTDFIGIDTRTGNGGNGDWDGTTGTPTYMTLAIGGLSAGNYDWTSFHHDTEHVHGPFAVWLSTDGGATFTQLADGIMTDSTEGGSPDSGATEVGPDVNSLSSVYHASFSADGVNDVVFRFAPYSSTAVHRQIWGMNGFELSLAP
jgi:hypothetical protein